MFVTCTERHRSCCMIAGARGCPTSLSASVGTYLFYHGALGQTSSSLARSRDLDLRVSRLLEQCLKSAGT